MQEPLPGSNGQGPLAGAFMQSLAAAGMSGRDPESLNGDEQVRCILRDVRRCLADLCTGSQNAVAAHMRRIGALPPLPPGAQQGQQLMRPQQGRVVSQQRMHPDQQQQQQQQMQQMQQRQQYPVRRRSLSACPRPR